MYQVVHKWLQICDFGFVSEIINNNAIQEIYVIGMSRSHKDTLFNIHKTLI